MLIKIIILGVVILAIVGSVFIIKTQRTSNSNQSKDLTTQTTSKKQTYQNPTFGYSLTLPDKWSVCANSNSEPTIRIGKNQKCDITWDDSFLITPTSGADYIPDRRQHEPLIFYVKRVEDQEKSVIGNSIKIDNKLTQMDPKTIMVESSYIPTDKSINPTFMVSIYKELTPTETIILNSEEENNPTAINKNNLIAAAQKLQNYDISTGDLIGTVSKKILNGQEFYPDYEFQVINKENKEETVIKAGKDGGFVAHLEPGTYILKTPTENQEFIIEKGRILRFNFTVSE